MCVRSLAALTLAALALGCGEQTLVEAIVTFSWEDFGSPPAGDVVLEFNSAESVAPTSVVEMERLCFVDGQTNGEARATYGFPDCVSTATVRASFFVASDCGPGDRSEEAAGSVEGVVGTSCGAFPRDVEAAPIALNISAP